MKPSVLLFFTELSLLGLVIVNIHRYSTLDGYGL